MKGQGDDLRVSIVIPTHNRCDRLLCLLSDLDRQDVPPQRYEAIVIDDGSTDDTRAAVAAARPCYRLAYARQECCGPASARNAGIRMARGEYVVLLDDDIRVGSSFVRAHIDAHAGFPDAIVFGPCWLPADRSSTPFLRYRRSLEATFAPPVGPDGTARVQAVASANLSARRALFERLGGYCEDLRIPGAEEYEFLGRLVQNDVPTVYSTRVEAWHDDAFITFPAYCVKNERYAIAGAEALARYPALVRQCDYARSLVRLNAPIAWSDGPPLIGRKVLKRVLSSRPALAVLKGLAALVETLGVPVLTESVYRLVIGLHIFRGFRAGLVTYRIQGISG
jgi:glucosyl-dolichyl phosphate glucuronosyltransferase